MTFNIGDPCWLHIGAADGNPLVKGYVVHIFEHHGTQYVVEVDTHVDPLLFVRSIFALSDSPKRPIMLFRRSKEERKRLIEMANKVREEHKA